MPYKKMPPQAYTRETLQEAFEWWSNQPEEFRSKIQDRDDLVGYYLRLQRKAEIEKPVENPEFKKVAFSSELKGLVKGLDAFDEYEFKNRPGVKVEEKKEEPVKKDLEENLRGRRVAEEKRSLFSPVPKAPEPKPRSKPSSPPIVFEPSSQLQFPDLSKKLVPTETEKVVKPLLKLKRPRVTPAPSISDRFFKLDRKSQKIIKETKEALNLSSEEEALRVVISLGARKLKSLF